jgi:hypothetical protein
LRIREQWTPELAQPAFKSREYLPLPAFQNGCRLYEFVSLILRFAQGLWIHPISAMLSHMILFVLHEEGPSNSD